MQLRFARYLIVTVFGCSAVALICGAAFSTRTEGPADREVVPTPSKISIDYPLEGSVFPPEITAPTFLWHDANENVRRWVFQISFAAGSAPLSVGVTGTPLRQGEIDPNAGAGLALTPEQASTHTWKPDAAIWEKIRQFSRNSPAHVEIKGFSDHSLEPVSLGQVTISTSPDPVGAPIFYRDVPLMLPPPEEKGPIAPLPRSAIPLIKWEIRDISQPSSHLVMTNLPTCANCHSFSRDGKTLGLDMDGPRNDKGLYALVPVSKEMTIRSSDVIHWSSFGVNAETRAADPAVKRFGFMSQVSP